MLIYLFYLKLRIKSVIFYCAIIFRMVYYNTCLIVQVHKTVFRCFLKVRALVWKECEIMENLLEDITKEQQRTDHPDFRPGDTIEVHAKVVEGTRERIQVFEGIVIKRQNGGIHETFTVRKTSYGVGVERTFQLHSPRVDKIEVSRKEIGRAHV